MYHQTNFTFKEDLKDLGFIRSIILHHSKDSRPHTAEDIHRVHQNRGMAGIGYHYFIDKNGEIYEGRPRHKMGAHARGYNNVSIGIGFEGDFNKETMGERQLNAAAMLIALLKLAYSDVPELKMWKSLNPKTDDPGSKFPFEKLNKRVDECKGYLSLLFGEQSYLDDQRDTLGNFDYEKLLDLLQEVESDDFFPGGEEDDDWERPDFVEEY